MNTTPTAPWTWARRTPYASMFRCEMKRSAQEPQLPLEAKFFASDQMRAYFLTNMDGPLLSVERKRFARPDYKPFTNGFLAGVFSVSSNTNFHGLDIPTECEFRVYHPGFKSYAQTYVLRVTGISRCSVDSFLPAIERRVFVSDMRFRDGSLGVDGIRYWFTNYWPTETNNQMIALFQKKREEARANLGRPGFWKRGKLQVTLIILVLLYPAIMAGWRRYMKRRKPA